MGRSPYQSEKRRKELARLKKQEEKRQRRFNKKHEGENAATETGETPPDAGTAPAAPTAPATSPEEQGQGPVQPS